MMHGSTTGRVRASQFLGVFTSVHTHVSPVEVGQFKQIAFQFLHHLFPSPPHCPFLPSLTIFTRSVSSTPLPPPLLSCSLSEVNAGSLRYSERMQHPWTTAGLQERADSSYGPPPQPIELKSASLWVVHAADSLYRQRLREKVGTPEAKYESQAWLLRIINKSSNKRMITECVVLCFYVYVLNRSFEGHN